MLTLLLAIACTGPAPDTADTGPRLVPWSGGLPRLSQDLPVVRGLQPRRALVHVHSPWSHDACDGKGLVDGQIHEQCLADLRRGLCETAIDVAFFTDHPAHAASQPFDDLFHAQPGDVREGAANVISCASGHQVRWVAGIEDELMPVGLDRHAGQDAAENDAIYNASSAEAVAADVAAGARVLMAHTEGKDLEKLRVLQQQGLLGVEIFNLHAMFAPDIRKEDLGLDSYGWTTAIAPFTSPEGTAEPDLLFLGVLQHQQPSIDRWLDLLSRGPTVAVAGTDAHQNVLPIDLRDGERGDSYRRMMRWFSNVILASGPTAAQAEDALAAGRLYVAYEVLGTPLGFDLHLSADDAVYELGSDAPAGTLHVGCPTLSPSSPRGSEAPEITVTVLRDGQPWQTGCGEFPADGPHVYHVEVDLVPHHLRPWLGDDPEPWLRSFPWIQSNAIRIGM